MGKILDAILFEAGSCIQKERLSIADGGWLDKRFPSICVLFKHSEHGYILYDTGYPLRRGKKGLKMSLYYWLMKVDSEESRLIVNQLDQYGVDPVEVRFVILSHFHPDHIGGVKQFPSAQFLCSRNCYETAKKSPGRSIFFESLLGDDFEKRCIFFEDLNVVSLSELHFSGFDLIYDIFGDQSLFSVRLDGHSFAQMGLFLTRGANRYFFVADAAWSFDSIVRNVAPHWITRLFQDDWNALKSNLFKLHKLYLNNPGWYFIPSHCSRLFEKRDNVLFRS